MFHLNKLKHNYLSLLNPISKSLTRTSTQLTEKFNKDHEASNSRRTLFNGTPRKTVSTSIASKLPLLDRFKENPYVRLMRLEKPTGSWLLFWPCGWGIALAASPGCWPDPFLLTLAATGSIVVRSAGCVLNDMWDKRIDEKVKRTRTRPLASGELSMADAFSSFMGLAGVGYVLLLNVNFQTVLLANGILALAISYPLMKRITHWPQLILGMVFNYGAILGWCAVKGDVLWSACLPLYAAGICWTIVYDTIYAHQDRKDDMKIGMKSTAIRFGENTKQWLTGFSTVMISGLLTSGIVCEQTWPYYAAVSIAGAHIANQIYTLNIDNPNDCAKKFVSNHHIGLVLFLGIIIGNLLKPKSDQKTLEK